MNIVINQSLHGYKEGHELLACSTELPIKARKILLFQSDLSGPNIYSGFEEYLTGYPLDEKTFALSKTWYAEEMRRPGCVWTHTLLINLPDLGKIPNLAIFLRYFKRPQIEQYGLYQTEIEIDISSQLKLQGYHSSQNKYTNYFSDLINGIYGNPQKTIFVSGTNGTQFEKIILDLWSDQWPSLRRNFLFCSGALSIKRLDEREFDLQIIPTQTASIILRQSKNPFLCDMNQVSDIDSDWVNILKHSKELPLRKFFWTYGILMEGIRENYIPLIKIYEAVYIKDNIRELFETIRSFYPSKDQALALKIELLGSKSPLLQKNPEVDLIRFICTYVDLDFIDVSEVNIDLRLADLFLTGAISTKDFFDLINTALPNRISKNIWSLIKLENIDVTYLDNLSQADLENIFIEFPNLALNVDIWEKQKNVQNAALNSLINQGVLLDWRPVINSILLSGSDIIEKAYSSIGENVINISLDLFNTNDENFLKSKKWLLEIVISHFSYFKKWVRDNYNSISPRLFYNIINESDVDYLIQIPLSSSFWIEVYKLVSDNYDKRKIKLSCYLLALGLNNTIHDSEKLLVATFHDVFRFAEKSEIPKNYWRLIPQETQDKDDQVGFFENIMSALGLIENKPPADWDYCDILIRTLCHKFIRFKWSNQSFIDTLKSENEFKLAINYCRTFTKGGWFLMQLGYDVRRDKLKIKNPQLKILQYYVLNNNKY